MSENCLNHIEDYWKSLITEGNNYFQQENYYEAIDFYTNALYRAEVLYTHSNICVESKVPVVKIYLTSCYKLIKAYQKLNKWEEAYKTYKKVYNILLCSTHHNLMKNEELIIELKKFSDNYAHFMKNRKLENHLIDSFYSNDHYTFLR